MQTFAAPNCRGLIKQVQLLQERQYAYSICSVYPRLRRARKSIPRAGLGCHQIQSLRTSSAIIRQTLSSNCFAGLCNLFTTSHNQLPPSQAAHLSFTDPIMHGIDNASVTRCATSSVQLSMSYFSQRVKRMGSFEAYSCGMPGS